LQGHRNNRALVRFLFATGIQNVDEHEEETTSETVLSLFLVGVAKICCKKMSKFVNNLTKLQIQHDRVKVI
jgi:hypothetical protein